ncbi:MAG: hypothetical protein ABL867_05940 [Rickettsiales bacterium]
MKILGVIALVLLGMYGCYHSVAPSATIRYKLTLTVDDNGKQYTGSSVVEVYRQDTTKVFAGIGGYGGNYKGEAVAVDLGEKGVLFALLRGKDTVDHPLYIFMKSFPEYFPARADITVIDGMRKLDHDKPKTNLSFDKLPMLVRFRDINDPKTVELVDPNDLEKTFGTGVKLVSATIEMTDEGVTSGVEKYISKASWKEHGYAEWRANLRYDQVIFDWEDFERK